MHVNPILVVDDNAQIVDILSQYIKKEGWPMLAARRRSPCSTRPSRR